MKAVVVENLAKHRISKLPDNKQIARIMPCYDESPKLLAREIFECLLDFTTTLLPQERKALFCFEHFQYDTICPWLESYWHLLTFDNKTDKAMPPTSLIVMQVKLLYTGTYQNIGTIAYFDFTNRKCVAKAILEFMKDVRRAGLHLITSCSSGQFEIMMILRELGVVVGEDNVLTYNLCPHQKIIHVFDSSWLLRKLKGEFYLNDIQFRYKKQNLTASYKYIAKVLALPNASIFKQEDYHQMTKTTTAAAKIFSQTIRKWLKKVEDSKITSSKITGCQSTQILVDMFDQLFDSFNSIWCHDSNSKIYLMAMTRFTPHVNLWANAVPVLKTMMFIPRKKNKSKDISNDTGKSDPALGSLKAIVLNEFMDEFLYKKTGRRKKDKKIEKDMEDWDQEFDNKEDVSKKNKNKNGFQNGKRNRGTKEENCLENGKKKLTKEGNCKEQNENYKNIKNKANKFEIKNKDSPVDNNNEENNKLKKKKTNLKENLNLNVDDDIKAIERILQESKALLSQAAIANANNEKKKKKKSKGPKGLEDTTPLKPPEVIIDQQENVTIEKTEIKNLKSKILNEKQKITEQKPKELPIEDVGAIKKTKIPKKNKAEEKIDKMDLNINKKLKVASKRLEARFQAATQALEQATLDPTQIKYYCDDEYTKNVQFQDDLTDFKKKIDELIGTKQNENGTGKMKGYLDYNLPISTIAASMSESLYSHSGFSKSHHDAFDQLFHIIIAHDACLRKDFGNTKSYNYLSMFIGDKLYAVYQTVSGDKRVFAKSFINALTEAIDFLEFIDMTLFDMWVSTIMGVYQIYNDLTISHRYESLDTKLINCDTLHSMMSKLLHYNGLTSVSIVEKHIYGESIDFPICVASFKAENQYIIDIDLRSEENQPKKNEDSE